MSDFLCVLEGKENNFQKFFNLAAFGLFQKYETYDLRNILTTVAVNSLSCPRAVLPCDK